MIELNELQTKLNNEENEKMLLIKEITQLKLSQFELVETNLQLSEEICRMKQEYQNLLQSHQIEFENIHQSWKNSLDLLTAQKTEKEQQIIKSLKDETTEKQKINELFFDCQMKYQQSQQKEEILQIALEESRSQLQKIQILLEKQSSSDKNISILNIIHDTVIIDDGGDDGMESENIFSFDSF